MDPITRWLASAAVGLILLAGTWFHGRHSGVEATRKAWDASIARGQIEMARLDASYRAQEHRHAADMARIGREHQEAMTDAQNAADRLVADLRAGNVRLQERWRGCRAAQVPGTGPGAGEPDAGADDRSASAGRVVRAAAECDVQVRGLQEIIRADRQ